MGKDTTEVRTELNGSNCPDLELRIRRLGSQVAQTEGARVCRWAQVRGWPLNCDVLPLNIKGASHFLRKCPSATLDIEPPEALCPATRGQAASLARVRGHPPHAAGGHRADSKAQPGIAAG